MENGQPKIETHVPGHPQEVRHRVIHSQKTTTEEQHYIYPADPPTSSPPQEDRPLPSVGEFPDGRNIVLKMGQTYLVAPCRNIDVSINQIIVPGGDLGTVATITCRDKTGATKKAEFACPGTQLDFRYESAPYQLICQ